MFNIPKSCGRGAPPPCAAVKLSAVCDSSRMGCVALTVMVTFTGCSICAPLCTATVPEYVPAVRVPGLAVTVMVAGDPADTLPEAGATLNQAPPEVVEAVRANDAVPLPW